MVADRSAAGSWVTEGLSSGSLGAPDRRQRFTGRVCEEAKADSPQQMGAKVDLKCPRGGPMNATPGLPQIDYVLTTVESEGQNQAMADTPTPNQTTAIRQLSAWVCQRYNRGVVSGIWRQPRHTCKKAS